MSYHDFLQKVKAWNDAEDYGALSAAYHSFTSKNFEDEILAKIDDIKKDRKSKLESDLLSLNPAKDISDLSLSPKYLKNCHKKVYNDARVKYLDEKTEIEAAELEKQVTNLLVVKQVYYHGTYDLEIDQEDKKSDLRKFLKDNCQDEIKKYKTRTSEQDKIKEFKKDIREIKKEINEHYEVSKLGASTTLNEFISREKELEQETNNHQDGIENNQNLLKPNDKNLSEVERQLNTIASQLLPEIRKFNEIHKKEHKFQDRDFYSETDHTSIFESKLVFYEDDKNQLNDLEKQNNDIEKKQNEINCLEEKLAKLEELHKEDQVKLKDVKKRFSKSKRFKKFKKQLKKKYTTPITKLKMKIGDNDNNIERLKELNNEQRKKYSKKRQRKITKLTKLNLTENDSKLRKQLSILEKERDEFDKTRSDIPEYEQCKKKESDCELIEKNIASARLQNEIAQANIEKQRELNKFIPQLNIDKDTIKKIKCLEKVITLKTKEDRLAKDLGKLKTEKIRLDREKRDLPIKLNIANKKFEAVKKQRSKAKELKELKGDFDYFKEQVAAQKTESMGELRKKIIKKAKGSFSLGIPELKKPSRNILKSEVNEKTKPKTGFWKKLGCNIGGGLGKFFGLLVSVIPAALISLVKYVKYKDRFKNKKQQYWSFLAKTDEFAELGNNFASNFRSGFVEMACEGSFKLLDGISNSTRNIKNLFAKNHKSKNIQSQPITTGFETKQKLANTRKNS